MERIIKIVLLFLIFISTCIVFAMKINQYNTKKCYENITKIQVGTDINVALNKMDRGLFLRKRKILIGDFSKNNGADYVVIYPYKDKKDPASSFPKIYYDSKTNKVVKIIIGLVY